MDSEIVETITEWDSASFEGGHDELRALADRRFSGAISDGMSWAFMSNGKLVGIVDGDLNSFSEASGTVYEAPEPVLPLLCVMRTQGGEERGKYYTEDTPVETVNETLSSGGFTGYLELSENVLSGDYYVVYYGGKAMSVAFVGNSRKLHTDEDAFDLLTDEVGIYTVRSVDIAVTEISSAGSASSASASSGSDSDTEDAVEAESDPAETSKAGDTDDTESPTHTADADSGDEAISTGSDADPDADMATAIESISDTPAEETTAPPGESTAAESEAPLDQSITTASNDTRKTAASPPEPDESDDPLADDTHPRASERGSDASEGSTGGADHASAFRGEVQWRETRSIPSLDPAKSRPDTNGASGANAASQQRGANSARAVQQTNQPSQSAQSDGSRQRRSAGPSERTGAEAKLARAKKLYKQLQEKAERLKAERDSAREERDEAREKADQLKLKVEGLESEIDRLNAEIERLEATQTDTASGESGRSISTTEAIAGTNLFVRYASKAKTTLKDIHDGDGTQTDLRENLRLEKHTTFDSEDCSIDGDPYEAFLTETIQYRFTRWVVEELLFEIIETGNQHGLRDLYDCIPHIDRAEFDGEVELQPAQGEGDEPLMATFDVVLRDRMGEPLLIANFNDSRQPARSGMIESLVRSGKDLCERSDSFGGSIAVTSSFFDPSALEAAGDATGGGLLSRSKAKSYVKIGRKLGFHLCLVESRESDFHMSVPEL